MNNDRLKFRVWDKNNKRYIYFDFFSHIQSRATEIGKVLDISYSSCGDNLIDATYHLRQTDKVEQCTGLRDINCNLIYEGDIIKCEIDIERELSVVWDDGCFGVYVPTHDDFVKFYTLGNFTKYEWEVQNIEIIGNIHEQAE